MALAAEVTPGEYPSSREELRELDATQRDVLEGLVNYVASQAGAGPLMTRALTRLTGMMGSLDAGAAPAVGKRRHSDAEELWKWFRKLDMQLVTHIGGDEIN